MMRQTHPSATPGSTLIARVAGLPMEILLPLRFTQTMQVIDDLFALENRLQAQAEPLSDTLYHVIGTLADKKIKYYLMAMRRAIYQVQLPKAPGADVWAALPIELAGALNTWLGEMQMLVDLRARGQEILEREWVEKSATLQQLAQLELFQQGLILASTDLYEDMLRWVQNSSGDAPQHDRQLELGLLTYLSRMATKTSPFSTFMSSGRGHWVEDGPLLTSTPGWQRRSAVTLNWSIAQRVAAELARWPEIQAELPLHVNSSLLEDAAQVRFLGWKQAGTRTGETVMKLANSPRMQQVHQLIRNATNPSYAAIQREIVQGYTPKDAVEIQRGLAQLIEMGLLELDPGIPDLAGDYLAQLLSTLQPYHSQRVESIAALLQKVQTSLRNYAVTTQPTERYKLRETIYTTLESIYQQLGLPERNIAIPANNAFYEDTLLDGSDVHCSLTSFDAALADLGLLQQLSALYDQNVPGRVAATAFFVDQYGEGASISLLRFYEDFCREQAQVGGWRPGYRVSGSHLGQLFAHGAAHIPGLMAELDQIHDLQEEFAQTFMHPSFAPGEVYQWNTPALSAFIARLPAFLTPPRSLAFSCQMLVREGAPQLVLNALRSGFGRSESHLHFLEARLDRSTPSRDMPGKQEGEPVWADILGVFGSNASLRIARTPYEITYPGTVSARPLDEQLPLNDLHTVHDPRTNHLRLVSHRLQREVLPVHLGLLDDRWQPPLYRFLLHLFSEGAVHALLPLLHLPDIEVLSAELPVHAYPRLYLGNLVLRRASWLVGTQHLPKREKGTSAFEYMLKVQRWLVAHHIPQECFARLPAADTKDRKPLYIDFHNYLSMMLFEQMVQHSEQIADPAERFLLLQETLPGREDLVLSDGKAAYVSEFIIELTRNNTGTDATLVE